MPHTSANGEHIPAIIIPPQSSNFPQSQSGKSRHSNDGAYGAGRDRRFVSAIPSALPTRETGFPSPRQLPGHNDGVDREQLQVLQYLVQAVRKAFPAMLAAPGNPDACCRIGTVIKAQVSRFGKDRTESDLHDPVASVRQPRAVFLLQREPNGKVVVIGYADEQESVTVSDIDGQRSENIKYYLTSGESQAQIDPSRIEARKGPHGKQKRNDILCS